MASSDVRTVAVSQILHGYGYIEGYDPQTYYEGLSSSSLIKLVSWPRKLAYKALDRLCLCGGEDIMDREAFWGAKHWAAHQMVGF